MNIGFIGLGNMATAIAQGLRASESFASAAICGYDANPAAAAAAREKYGIDPKADIAAVLDTAEVVVLAVKPQILPQVLPELTEKTAEKLIITIAAGKTLDFYKSYLGTAAVVRVMPNINAKVGAACSALCCSPETSPAQLELARDIFATVGATLVIPESQFSAFCAVSGSAVAFVYLYIDAMARAGVQAGFSRAAAQEIAAAVVAGSAKLVQESGEHPMALVDQVCSPAGTTIEGIQTLQRLGFESALHQAVAAVLEKDRQLGK